MSSPARATCPPDLPHLLKVARGDAPADLVLKDAGVVNVFTGEIESADIAIVGEWIAGVGSGYAGKLTESMHGATVVPGLIDAHVHIESSLCIPAEFAAAVLPRGVTAAVTDPHEIANVAGDAGVRFMAESARLLPMDLIIMAPSCVPATPMASSGGALSAEHLVALRHDGIVHGLAELMNFPGAIHGQEEVLAKLRAMRQTPVDGHCPGVVGKPLNAYVAAGIGSDHESVTVAEAKEKLARGLYLLIREATNARNLDALLPVITPENARRVCFCTDDRTPGDLIRQGSIDYMLRRAIEFGIRPLDALRMCTLNPAEWFGLHHMGAIAPGRVASMVVIDNLKHFQARRVMSRGKWVSEAGRLTADFSRLRPPAQRLGNCHVELDKVDLTIRTTGKRVRVIEHLPNQLITRQLLMVPKVQHGQISADVPADVLKMAVLERHRNTGNIGLGLIKGIGLRQGAIAGTVAHDHHNLVVIGADDESMRTAIQAVVGMGGGLAVADAGQVKAKLALPIGGLMTDQPVSSAAAQYDTCIAAAKSLGSPLHDPFMAMSFMALEVIPSLKLTDQGLVDVEKFAIVELGSD